VRSSSAANRSLHEYGIKSLLSRGGPLVYILAMAPGELLDELNGLSNACNAWRFYNVAMKYMGVLRQRYPWGDADARRVTA
jgi:hypothetical protein